MQTPKRVCATSTVRNGALHETACYVVSKGTVCLCISIQTCLFDCNIIYLVKYAKQYIPTPEASGRE